MSHDMQGGSCVVCEMPSGTARWWRMAWAGCPGVRWLRVAELASHPELVTRTALRRQGLKPGGAPVACYYSKLAGDYRMLYDARQARPVRQVTPRQREAIQKALQAAQAALTCSWCKLRVRNKGRLTWMVDGHRLCRDCVRRWRCGMAAREVLADPEHMCILDSETTGLSAADGDQVVELAVLGLEGEGEGAEGGAVLLNTLIRPGRSIPPVASAIHGIRDADVAGAPSFADVLPQLVAAVAGRMVLIYNSAFDLGMIAVECERLGQPCPLSWDNTVCMMQLYSEYVGNWSDWWGDYEWVPLNGGHRALEDCRAVLQRVRKMAAIPASPYPEPTPEEWAALQARLAAAAADDLPF